METNALRIAVVGAGGMGAVHISNYAHIEGARVTAVCDAAEAGAARAAEIGANFYRDLSSLLAAEEVDVVDVCTPTFLHREHAAAALRAGKHVICEKPLALQRQDAAELYRLADENRVGLFVAHVVQYAPETRVLRELVRGGEYGRALDAQFLRLSACPRWARDGWLLDRERSGLLPFDLHIHDLDLIVHLFGAPKTLSYTSCGGEGRGYREHYRFLYGCDGMNVAAEAAWYNADFPFTATWRVYFENAVVVNDGQGVTAYPLDGEPRVFDTTEAVKIPTGINLPPTGIFLTELTDLLDRIRRGDRASDRREEILATLEILEKIS